MTEENPSAKTAHLEPLSLLWRFFAVPQTLLVLMGLVAVALLLGTVFPQVPSYAADDPQAWLAVQPGILGQRSDLVRALGLFDVYHAVWFHLLLALTGLTLFVWTVDSADLAWRVTVRGRWAPTAFAAWGRHAPRIELPSSLPQQSALARLYDLLTQHGYRWVDVPGLSTPNLVASRRALVLWAAPAIYGGFLVSLVGLGIMGTWGWQNEDWQLTPGESRAVGHGTSLTLRLDAFDLQLDGDSRVHDPVSEVTWLEDGSAGARGAAKNGRPSVFRGVAVRQIGYVPVVRLSGQDSQGRRLAFQVEGEEAIAAHEVEIAFPTLDAQPLVLISGHDLFLALTSVPLSAEGGSGLQVAQLGSGGATQEPLSVLSQSGTVDVDNLQVDVDLDYRPILRIDHRPAMDLTIGGLALAVAALAVVWLVPPRLLWIAVGMDEGGTTLVHLLPRPSARGSRWPQRLAARLPEGLLDDD